MNPLMEVHELFCERDDRVLFEHLSFTVLSGDIFRIEGQNGSGKTSLLRILAGLSHGFEGRISWRGKSIAQGHDAFLAAMLYLGHKPGIKGPLTPIENLRWYRAVAPLSDIGSIEAALQRMGLSGYEDVPCHALSAGQQRRVGLARLYMNRAPLWILDEPFTAIDKRGVQELEALISKHAHEGGAVLVTTHHDLCVSDGYKTIDLDRGEPTIPENV